MATLKDLICNVPVVSALIEREHEGEKQLLIQTRWKPERDPAYSGTLEIPAGWMKVYENVYDALRREVREETGLEVVRILPDIKTRNHSTRNDPNFAFVSFCCQQQLGGEGAFPWVGYVFLCQVEDKEPVSQKSETANPRWVNVSEVRRMLEHSPERLFILQHGTLDFYLNHDWRRMYGDF